MNPVRHGLVAKTVVLQDEAPEAFQALVAEFIHRFQPADNVELALVEDMAAARWRQRRAWAIETEMLDAACAQVSHSSAVSPLAQAFANLAEGPALALLHRYETRQARLFQRAFANLIALRKEILPNEPNPDSEHGQDIAGTPVPEPEPAAPDAPAAAAPAPAPAAPALKRPVLLEDTIGDFFGLSDLPARGPRPGPPR